MEDQRIIELYWQRKEEAVEETSVKYGKYCFSIAYNILSDREDAKECVNDTYVDAWNSMPPHRPSVLSSFLGKVTRRISIDRWRKKTAKKRGGGEVQLALEELSECIADRSSVEKEIEQKQLGELINCFVKSLPEVEQKVFLCRYWYLDSVEQICDQFGFSESKVKSMLFRSRGKLRKVLSKEGSDESR